VGHVARMTQIINAYIFLFQNHKGREKHTRPSSRKESVIKIDLREICGLDLTHSG